MFLVIHEYYEILGGVSNSYIKNMQGYETTSVKLGLSSIVFNSFPLALCNVFPIVFQYGNLVECLASSLYISYLIDARFKLQLQLLLLVQHTTYQTQLRSHYKCTAPKKQSKPSNNHNRRHLQLR